MNFVKCDFIPSISAYSIEWVARRFIAKYQWYPGEFLGSGPIAWEYRSLFTENVIRKYVNEYVKSFQSFMPACVCRGKDGISHIGKTELIDSECNMLCD